MGETKEENFMRITVKQKSTDIELIPLNKEVLLGHITDYDIYDHFLEMFKNQRKYLFAIYIREIDKLKKAFFNIIIKDHPD